MPDTRILESLTPAPSWCLGVLLALYRSAVRARSDRVGPKDRTRRLLSSRHDGPGLLRLDVHVAVFGAERDCRRTRADDADLVF